MSVFVGDIGVQFRLDAKKDISTNTSLGVRYRKPDGTTGLWTGTIFGTDYVTYTTVSGDLDLSGVWVLQIYIVTSNYTAHGKKAQVFVDVPIS